MFLSSCANSIEEVVRWQRAQMGQDDLYFIGAQMTNLYTYLEGLGDQKLLDFLWQIEQESC